MAIGNSTEATLRILYASSSVGRSARVEAPRGCLPSGSHPSSDGLA
jgi:hypothetical protein